MTPDNGVGMRLKEKFTLDMRKDISLCSQSVFSKLSQRPKKYHGHRNEIYILVIVIAP